MEAGGRRCILVKGDVGDPATCERAVKQTLEAFGKLDVLVSNAAFQRRARDLTELPLEQIERTFRTNVLGYMILAKAALPHLRPGAAIIATSSETGLFGNPHREKIECLDERARGLYLVAEHAGTVVGHAFLESLQLAATSHVVKLTIAVHEGHQRQGVGRALMNELLRWARSNPHVEKVELQVRSSNDGAIALYRSLGFIEEGRKTRRLKIGPGEYLDDVYMALWVGP